VGVSLSTSEPPRLAVLTKVYAGSTAVVGADVREVADIDQYLRAMPAR
jgi:hypothetical protein